MSIEVRRSAAKERGIDNPSKCSRLGRVRLRLAVIVLAILSAFGVIAPPSAQAQPFTNSRVADAGVSEVGTRRAVGWDQPGECIKSAQRWVAAAGGQFGGGGVLSGYRNSGAEQVDLSQAVKGDVLQYTNGNDEDWSRVHTVVVVANKGGGVYSIVQSNSPGYVNGVWRSDGSGLVTTNPDWMAVDPNSGGAYAGWYWTAWRFGTIGNDVQAGVQVNWVNYPGSAREIAFVTIQGGWELFHVGTNNVIYRKVLRNGSLSGWQAIAGPRALKVAAAGSSDGRVELFYIGMNNQIYHHWESSPGGSIANWEGLGGYATELAAARSGSNWEVFHVGGSGTMWRATQANHGWSQVQGWASKITAATSRDGRVELFHVGGGGNVFHAWQTSPGRGFTGWVDMGGSRVSDIGASSVGNGEFELFAVTLDGKMWRQAPWSGVNSWQAMNGWASKISATKNPDGRVEVAHIGGSGSMWHAWQQVPGLF